MKQEGKRLEKGAPSRRADGEVRGFRRFWKNWGEILMPLAVIFVLFKFIIQIAWVPSGSMETTIPTKSLMLGWQLPFVVSDPAPRRGDIVTFWNDELDKLLVKRVVGMPGERLTFSDGYVYVNGQLLDEYYLPARGVTECDESFLIPADCVLMLGDNRGGSLDARFWEAPYTPIADIQARPFVCISIGQDQSWQGVRLIERGAES